MIELLWKTIKIVDIENNYWNFLKSEFCKVLNLIIHLKLKSSKTWNEKFQTSELVKFICLWKIVNAILLALIID